MAIKYKKMRTTYCSLNDFPGLVLPVLRIRFSSCNFRSLLIRTTPCKFNIGELVVRMQHFKALIKILNPKGINRKTYQVQGQS